LEEELTEIKSVIGDERFARGKFDAAQQLFDRITTSDEFAEFLTLPGYELLD
jgi:malate synthase